MATDGLFELCSRKSFSKRARSRSWAKTGSSRSLDSLDSALKLFCAEELASPFPATPAPVDIMTSWYFYRNSPVLFAVGSL